MEKIYKDGMSIGFYGKDGNFYLERCPKCARENYLPAVSSGQCAWCGYKHEELSLIFMLEGTEKAKGGYYVRSSLSKFAKKLIESGLKPVGIRINDSMNVEFFVESD